MTWPVNFAGLAAGPQPLSDFDQMFNQTAAMLPIPSAALGSNAISLSPLVNCPTLQAYTEFCNFRFRAVATSTGPVTAQFGGLGLLNVYHQDGVTQASTGDIIIGQCYTLIYSASLNSNAGGFFLIVEGVPNTSSVQLLTPGGRLTAQSGIPIPNVNLANQTTFYYAPYKSNTCPVYNGSAVSMVQFTSSLSDVVGLTYAMAGNAAWPINTLFDVYLTLNPGPILVTVPWTNVTTRATLLAIFGGFLTNASAATARVNSSTTITLAQNQGTYLGTVGTNGTTGTFDFILNGTASGGGVASLGIYNYHNRANFSLFVKDTQAPYTYGSSTVRRAGGAAAPANTVTLVLGSAEDAVLMNYFQQGDTPSPAGEDFITGPATNLSTPAFFTAFLVTNGPGTGSVAIWCATPAQTTGLGQLIVFPGEAGDGVTAATFNASSKNTFYVVARM